MKTHQDLEIYKKGFSLFLKTHAASKMLPKYELYELGSQLRRSADSIITNIVEGYGRKHYKNDFIKFLIYSSASTLETIHHLEKLISLYPEKESEFKNLMKEYDILSAQIYTFTKYVAHKWKPSQLK
jgi:four helix bundle protein